MLFTLNALDCALHEVYGWHKSLSSAAEHNKLTFCTVEQQVVLACKRLADAKEDAETLYARGKEDNVVGISKCSAKLICNPAATSTPTKPL